MTRPIHTVAACAAASRILNHLRAAGSRTPDQIAAAMGPNVTVDEVHDALTLLVGRQDVEAMSIMGKLAYRARAKA